MASAYTSHIAAAYAAGVWRAARSAAAAASSRAASRSPNSRSTPAAKASGVGSVHPPRPAQRTVLVQYPVDQHGRHPGEPGLL